MVEAKTKYQQLLEDLRGTNLDCGHIIEDLVQELSRATEEFKSDQSEKHYFGLLINLEIMSQGCIGSKKGTESLSNSDIGKIKKILTDQVERGDHQFAYICYLIQRLGLCNRVKLIEFLANAAAVEKSLSNVRLLSKNPFFLSIQEKIIRHLANEEDASRKWLLNHLQTSIVDFSTGDNNPLQYHSASSGGTFYRFSLDNYSSYGALQDSLTQFSEVNFTTKLTQDMNNLILQLTGAASEYYSDPNVSTKNKNRCKDLLNEIYLFTHKAARALNNSSDGIDKHILSDLINEADNIHGNINILKQDSPHDLHWGKILGVAICTLLVGLLWIIPSLSCCGNNSFFRRTPPIVEKARELVWEIQDKLEVFNQPDEYPVSSPLLN